MTECYEYKFGLSKYYTKSPVPFGMTEFSYIVYVEEHKLLHNLNGPAIIDVYPPPSTYYIDGVKMSEAEHAKQSAIIKHQLQFSSVLDKIISD